MHLLLFFHWGLELPPDLCDSLWEQTRPAVRTAIMRETFTEEMRDYALNVAKMRESVFEEATSHEKWWFSLDEVTAVNPMKKHFLVRTDKKGANDYAIVYSHAEGGPSFNSYEPNSWSKWRLVLEHALVITSFLDLAFSITQENLTPGHVPEKSNIHDINHKKEMFNLTQRSSVTCFSSTDSPHALTRFDFISSGPCFEIKTFGATKQVTLSFEAHVRFINCDFRHLHEVAVLFACQLHKAKCWNIVDQMPFTFARMRSGILKKMNFNEATLMQTKALQSIDSRDTQSRDASPTRKKHVA